MNYMKKPIVYIALTNTRIGAPETPTRVVDLPLYRNPFGFIVINGQYIKGAVRNSCHNAGVNEKVEKFFFGDEEHSSYVIFNNATATFIPIPSKDFGIIYVTCPALLNEIMINLNNTCKDNLRNYLCQLIEALLNQENYLGDDQITLYSIDKDIKKVELYGGEITLQPVSFENLKPLFKILIDLLSDTPIKNFIGCLGIVSDTMFQVILKRSLAIRPGIKLKGMKGSVYCKVVEEGPWFEEEIPKFSVFIGSVTMKKIKVPISKLSVRDIANTLNSYGVEYVEEKGVKYVKVEEPTLEKFINSHVQEILMGAKETAGRGLFLTKEINEPENLTGEKMEIAGLNSKTVPIQAYNSIEKMLSYFNMLKKECRNDKQVGELCKNIKGKFSSLPERISRLGISLSYYFYSKVKKESKGEGYEEVRELLNRVVNETGLEKPESFIQFYTVTYDSITALKYIIRAYEAD